MIDKYKEYLPILESKNLEILNEIDEETIRVKCNHCMNEFNVNAESFFNDPKCDNSKCIKRQKAVDRVKEIAKDEYTVLKNFYSLDSKSKDYSKILIRHNTCGHEYSVIPRNFVYGRRCPKCRKTPFKSPEQYEKDFNKAGEGNFDLLTPYVRASEKVWAIHSKGCKEKFEVNAGYFLRDPRCPKCEKGIQEKGL